MGSSSGDPGLPSTKAKVTDTSCQNADLDNCGKKKKSTKATASPENADQDSITSTPLPLITNFVPLTLLTRTDQLTRLQDQLSAFARIFERFQIEVW